MNTHVWIELIPNNTCVPEEHIVSMDTTRNSAGFILLVIFIIGNDALSCFGRHLSTEERKGKISRFLYHPNGLSECSTGFTNVLSIISNLEHRNKHTMKWE